MTGSKMSSCPLAGLSCAASLARLTPIPKVGMRPSPTFAKLRLPALQVQSNCQSLIRISLAASGAASLTRNYLMQYQPAWLRFTVPPKDSERVETPRLRRTHFL